MSGKTLFGLMILFGLVCFLILIFTNGQGIIIDHPLFSDLPKVQIVSP